MVSGYAEKFKMAEPSDYSSLSEDNEYSDPLEVAAANAGARLSTPEKASISRKREVQTNYCWFSHDVTKMQTKKLSILPRFYFHDALQ